MAFNLSFFGLDPKSAKGKPGPRIWTSNDVRQLRQLVKDGTPFRTISLKLGRSEDAIRTKWAEVQEADTQTEAAKNSAAKARLVHH